MLVKNLQNRSNRFRSIITGVSCNALFIILLLHACSFSFYPDSNHPGEKIYAEYCADCHGRDLESFASWEWTYGKSREAVIESVMNGRDYGAMPAFGESLDGEKLNDLVDYMLGGIKALEDNPPAPKIIPASRTYKSRELSFNLEILVDDMDIPWGLAFLPDDRILVTEKSGRLFLVDKDRTKKEIFQVPEVNPGGQGGLMDVALHPDYASNGWIYLSYSKVQNKEGRSGNTTAVARYRLKSNVLADEEIIFEAQPYSRTRHHYGSRLLFDRDGYLFITIGDRGARDVNPQRIDLYPGKVHRLHDDGSIPSDNPFAEMDDAVQSIWSYGHRNAQGMALEPSTGQVWVHEHGPRGGDELNRVQKAKNYGWPIVSYGINYNGTRFTDRTEAPEFESPIHYWVPSIAPSGMTFVDGDVYPGWEGDLLLGSLKFEYLHFCEMDKGKVTGEQRLMEGIGRVRDVKQAPDGYIYVTVENPGRVYRIVPERQ